VRKKTNQTPARISNLSDEQWAELQPFYSWASQTWCEAVSQAARHVEFQRNIRTFPAFVQSLINILSERTGCSLNDDTFK
jgi:hypothetical protein